MAVYGITGKVKQLPDKTHLVTLYIQCTGADKDALMEWMGHDGTGGHEVVFDGESLTIYDTEPRRKGGI